MAVGATAAWGVLAIAVVIALAYQFHPAVKSKEEYDANMPTDDWAPRPVQCGVCNGKFMPEFQFVHTEEKYNAQTGRLIESRPFEAMLCPHCNCIVKLKPLSGARPQ